MVEHPFLTSFKSTSEGRLSSAGILSSPSEFYHHLHYIFFSSSYIIYFLFSSINACPNIISHPSIFYLLANFPPSPSYNLLLPSCCSSQTYSQTSSHSSVCQTLPISVCSDTFFLRCPISLYHFSNIKYTGTHNFLHVSSIHTHIIQCKLLLFCVLCSFIQPIPYTIQDLYPHFIYAFLHPPNILFSQPSSSHIWEFISPPIIIPKPSSRALQTTPLMYSNFKMFSFLRTPSQFMFTLPTSHSNLWSLCPIFAYTFHLVHHFLITHCVDPLC